ncbi:radical SAM/SPASM domain-containing protein [Azospirillum brasilense]|uniref:Radical SAM protein n=1 Tax=Azospirillum brasilense TaxID=192 RepID=A0A6L3B7H8_AZOBR|nr:radical SAM/SPASM domain-containing protein [Azospirillum brasilense]KAA0688642.1 radical SAM protein [Azospirillum brasilense]
MTEVSTEAAAPANIPYGRHRDRNDLSQVLPLTTPFSLLIDPSNGCNFRCVFCATGNPELLKEIGRPRGAMKFDLFRKIADDIAAFDAPIKSVHLYKDGEPLVNTRIEHMVHLLKSRGLARHVEMTSNGSLLTPERADALLAAGLDAMRVSVYGASDAMYKRITRRFDRFQTVVDNVAYLYRRKTELGRDFHLHCKIINVELTEEERQSFIDTFTPIADSLFVHPLHGEALADESAFAVAPDTARKVCSEPFLKLAINFNGEVSVCCADWGMGTIVGNVAEESLRDIWNGERLRDFRLKHLEGRRDEIEACRGCSYVQTLPADNNLDGFAADLIAKYRA